MQSVESIALVPKNRISTIPPRESISSLHRFLRLKVVLPYVLLAVTFAIVVTVVAIGRTQTFAVTTIVACILSIILGWMAYRWSKRISIPLEAMADTVEQLMRYQQSGAKVSGNLSEFAHELTGLSEITVQIRQLTHLRMLLTTYLGNDIALRILDGETNLGGQAIWATALFADIRDFTALTESSNIHELFEELNEYYAVIQRVITAHGGVINKFGGDSVLALFGAPTHLDGHEFSAVIAAGAIMDELAILNESRKQQGRSPFRIGIGVNTGEMMIGNLGSEQRLEYTVLGDSVNVAKRLSDLSKDTPFYSIYVGHECVEAMGQLPSSWEVDSWGEVKVKGRQQPVETYSVLPGEMFSTVQS